MIGVFVLDLVMRSTFQLLVAIVYIGLLVGGGWYLLSGKFMENRRATQAEEAPAAIEEQALEGDAEEADPATEEPMSADEAGETDAAPGSEDSVSNEGSINADVEAGDVAEEEAPSDEALDEPTEEALDDSEPEDEATGDDNTPSTTPAP